MTALGLHNPDQVRALVTRAKAAGLIAEPIAADAFDATMRWLDEMQAGLHAI